MDFWLSSAVPYNQICAGEPLEAITQAPVCDADPLAVSNRNFCLGADQLADPDVAAISLDGGMASVMGDGCANDGGPLWVTMPLEDDTDPVWAIFYQRVPEANSVGQGAQEDPEVS